MQLFYRNCGRVCDCQWTELFHCFEYIQASMVSPVIVTVFNQFQQHRGIHISEVNDNKLRKNSLKWDTPGVVNGAMKH